MHLTTVQISNIFRLSAVAGAGGEQPDGGDLSAAEADPLATHHRVLQRARQHGNVAALHGGRQQVRIIEYYLTHCWGCVLVPLCVKRSARSCERERRLESTRVSETRDSSLASRSYTAEASVRTNTHYVRKK